MEFSQYKSKAMQKLESALSEGLVDEGVISVLNSLIHILIFSQHLAAQVEFN